MDYRIKRQASGEGYYRYRDTTTGRFCKAELWFRERTAVEREPEYSDELTEALDRRIEEYEHILERLEEIMYGDGVELDYGDIEDIPYTQERG